MSRLLCHYMLLHIRAEVVSHIPPVPLAFDDTFPDQRSHVPGDVRTRYDEPGCDILPRNSRVLQNKIYYSDLRMLVKVSGQYLLQVGTGAHTNVVPHSPTILLGSDPSHPAQYPHMIPEGPDIHPQHLRQVPHASSRILPDTRTYCISIFVVQDIPTCDSFMAKLKPRRQREQDLYQNEKRDRKGYG